VGNPVSFLSVAWGQFNLKIKPHAAKVYEKKVVHFLKGPFTYLGNHREIKLPIRC